MGSRAALSFAFAFLRRAWRSGEKVCSRGSSSVDQEIRPIHVGGGGGSPAVPLTFSVVSSGDDADLCSELLQESLDALRALPEATLFDEGSVSSVWLEVVERATKFLRSVLLLHQHNYRIRTVLCLCDHGVV